MKRKSAVALWSWQKQALYTATGILWLSGALWLCWSKSSLLKIHGAAAMAFLILFGTLLTQHVPQGWRQDKHRPSGSWIFASSTVLIVTGWGLYYFGNETLRAWTSRIHWILGLLLPVILFIHVLATKRHD